MDTSKSQENTFNSNQVIWTGHPSQLTNFFTYLINLFLIAVVIVATEYILRDKEVADLVIFNPFTVKYIIYSVSGILILFALWNMLKVYILKRSTIYQITENRLILKTGILDKVTDQLELYRIKDYELFEPLHYRIFNVGHIKLISSDKTHPEVLLYAVHDAEKIFTMLRNQVEMKRKQTGTREFD